MAAQLEEALIHADPLHAQQLGPDVGQRPLQLVARGHVTFGARRAARLGQRRAIHFAVHVQRQPFESDEGGRHHVVRQSLREVCAQFAVARLRPLRGHEVRHQPHVAAFVFTQNSDGLAHGSVCGEHGLDLPQLNPEAPEFDLSVEAAQVLQAAVGQVTDFIARLVEARAGPCGEGVWDETLRRQAGAVDIAVREAFAADVQLAGGAGRHGLKPRIEYVGLHVGDGASDGDVPRVARAFTLPCGHVDGGLGRAVLVMQFGPEAREELLL